MKLEEMTVKICLVGDSAVGKTSLIRRYVFDYFDDKYISTLGTKVTLRETIIPYPDSDFQVQMKMLIFDIIGDKNYRNLLKDSYFNGANGVIAVCDLTRNETLDSLNEWIETAFEVAGDAHLHLLANKTDLEDEVELSESRVSELSIRYDSPFSFVSAKTGENVEKTFQSLARRLADRVIAVRNTASGVGQQEWSIGGSNQLAGQDDCESYL